MYVPPATTANAPPGETLVRSAVRVREGWRVPGAIEMRVRRSGVATSVGYGAHLEGLVPLLAMMNGCAPGIQGGASRPHSILRP